MIKTLYHKEKDLVETEKEYLYSSARIWKHIPIENEPLQIGVNQIEWRQV